MERDREKERELKERIERNHKIKGEIDRDWVER